MWVLYKTLIDKTFFIILLKSEITGNTLDYRCKVVGHFLLFKYIQYNFFYLWGKSKGKWQALEYSKHVSNKISLNFL